MLDPIWKRTDIGVTEYRLLWFLIDVGCMNNVTERGWLNKCAGCMGIHRTTVYRTVNRLISKELLIRRQKGSVEFNMAGFASTLPEDFIKMKKVENHVSAD